MGLLVAEKRNLSSELATLKVFGLLPVFTYSSADVVCWLSAARLSLLIVDPFCLGQAAQPIRAAGPIPLSLCLLACSLVAFDSLVQAAQPNRAAGLYALCLLVNALLVDSSELQPSPVCARPQKKENLLRCRTKLNWKGYSCRTLIKNVNGGNKFENFHTQKSVETELPPHQDLNYSSNKFPPFKK